jgi:DNA-directed RNA polymerase subunit RPC12/RpoP
MTDYSELIKKLRDLHRDPRPASAEWLFENQVALYDAAAAIEALQAAEPTEKQVIDYCHKRCMVVLEADLFHELKASYGKTPKRGEWKPFDLTWGRSIYSCTVCGESVYVPTANGKALYNYCPNCGARMTEVQE